MLDEPDAATLLEAMATTLTERIMPVLEGGLRHETRVIANLCRIVARELTADPAPQQRALVDLLGHDDELATLVAALDTAISEGRAPAGTLEFLSIDAAHRAEITRPGYTFAADDA